MIKFFFIIGALVWGEAISFASACPQLTGKYQCLDFESGEPQTVIINQSIASGFTNFEFEIQSGDQTENRVYRADNQKKKIHSELAQYTEKSSCQGNKLEVELYGVDDQTGDVLSAVIKIYLDEKLNLYNSLNGKFGKSPIAFEETCQKI